MGGKQEIQQGTLALMVLKTLETMGPLHGYGIARRIEQTSGGRLAINYGTLYPALLRLEQEGHVAAEWGVADHHRPAKYHRAAPRRPQAPGAGGPGVGGDRVTPRALPDADRVVMGRLRAWWARATGFL